MADQPSSSALVVAPASEGGGAGVHVEGGMREYRKGNWTLHETVVLIAAKKMDDERRLKGGDRERNRTAELRWKWIENYCWRNGCHRNQNQCNDKWDNLLRDYKKVRDYEMRVAQQAVQTVEHQHHQAGGSSSSSGAAMQGQGLHHQSAASYWLLEKHERKEKGLPSNLLFQVYEALHEVVDKRYPPRLPHPQLSAPPAQLPLPPPPPPLPPPLPLPPPQHQLQHQLQHPADQQMNVQQQQQQQSGGSVLDKASAINMQQPATHPTAAAAQSSAAPTSSAQPMQQGHPSSEPSESSESEESEIPASPAKRRRKVGSFKGGDGVHSHAEAYSGGGGGGLGPAVARSTAELTQTLLACEEKKDRRHRDMLGVEERKLHIEKTKVDISREGIAGLITAINNLSSAILSLASDKN